MFDELMLKDLTEDNSDYIIKPFNFRAKLQRSTGAALDICLIQNQGYQLVLKT